MPRAWCVAPPVSAFDRVTATDYPSEVGDVACRPMGTDPKAGMRGCADPASFLYEEEHLAPEPGFHLANAL